ncbi:hypothetical protein [Thermasporomyces composti]|uniref:Uncharacterized protein n=1 Tax=Thermasporomyces composti TaxID=696763 RepID=A0A3D9V544_THECX|nr:hypothetical protein [Thermasporomyces composti]REF36647.1 hypothetical protein DFJ64_2064 [Thermasporomyces composti]
MKAALAAAREAYAAATDALARAEEAARAVGLDVDQSDEPVRELRAQRIRIVEPDGTTRMLIGNSTIASIAPTRGEDQEHPGRGTFGGILFCNDEGTEAGGLIYAGHRNNGKPSQLGLWTAEGAVKITATAADGTDHTLFSSEATHNGAPTAPAM